MVNLKNCSSKHQGLVRCPTSKRAREPHLLTILTADTVLLSLVPSKARPLQRASTLTGRVVPHDGVIGLDLLNNYDIAVDVGNQQVAFRPIQSDQKRLSLSPFSWRRYRQKSTKNSTLKPQKKKKACEPTAQDWKELASFQTQMGQLDAAYESTLKRTELAPNSCASG